MLSKTPSFGMLILSLGLLAAHADEHKSVSVERIDDAIHYRGPITPDGVKQLLTTHDRDNILWLVMNSAGGEVNLAMDLGDWVFQKNLRVRVVDRCLSSCANYIFTAATVKVVTQGAIVAWHGSAIQSDVQSRAEISEVIETEILPRTPTSQHATVKSKILRETLDSLKRSRERQAKFFEKIQVDERITTIGEGHPAIQDFWFLSVAAMERFGIGFVVAPSDYAATNTARFGEDTVTYFATDAK